MGLKSLADKNLAYAVKKFPKADSVPLAARLGTVAWPVGTKAKVCEVTVNSACNIKCLFCYSHPGSFSAKASEPDLDSIFRVLYAGRKQGCWIASVIGGEPSLRQDIDKIASFARKAGYSCVKLSTNGIKLESADYVKRLVRAGFNMFDVSLHAHKSDIHDGLVRVPGAFDKVLRGIDNVRKSGCELGLNQVINAVNYRYFPEFFEWAYEDLGVSYFNIIYGHYRGVMAVNSEVLKVKISAVLPYIKRGLKPLVSSNIPAFCTMLVNFPPCLLPEYLEVLADWESDPASGSPLLLTDGTVLNMAEMKNKQSVKTENCVHCVLNSRCRGFDAEYFDLFGGSEFKPIGSLPKRKIARLPQ